MSNIPAYNGTKDSDGNIEGNYLPTPRTFVKIGKMPKAWGAENLTEMGITHLFSMDGNDWGSVDTAIFKDALKKEILSNSRNQQLRYEYGFRKVSKMQRMDCRREPRLGHQC